MKKNKNAYTEDEDQPYYVCLEHEIEYDEKHPTGLAELKDQIASMLEDGETEESEICIFKLIPITIKVTKRTEMIKREHVDVELFDE